MVNLAVDIGNSRTKAGIFDGAQKMIATQQWDHFVSDQLLELATNHNINNVIFSSVNDTLSEAHIEPFAKQFYCIQLDAQTPLPIDNHYSTPETLGKDRLAAIVGAFELYPGEHCLVIDAGTCITYEVLEAGGHYRGGNIAPGLQMRLKAMHHFTKRLPAVAPEQVEDPIGKSTTHAMQNGATLGLLLEIEGFIDLCCKLFGKIRVILTGGDADFLALQLKREIFVHHNLVLQGLNKILSYNVKLSY